MSEPLDMERPLWQLYLVEGLSGRHAYISKTHHALVDGVAAVDVGTILLDTSKRGTRVRVPEMPWDPDEPSPTMLLSQAATERVRKPLRAAGRAARSAVTTPAQTAAGVLRTAEAFTSLASGGPRRRPLQPAQRQDRPRPPDRLGAHRPRPPEARPRRGGRLDRQRRGPVGRGWRSAPLPGAAR